MKKKTDKELLFERMEIVNPDFNKPELAEVSDKNIPINMYRKLYLLAKDTTGELLKEFETLLNFLFNGQTPPHIITSLSISNSPDEFMRNVASFEGLNENDILEELEEDIGGTKDAEYRRTIQLFEEIYKNKGLYYALALLYDSQYDREDIKNMMELIYPKK